LDVKKHECQFKETNVDKVHSEAAISGGKLCKPDVPDGLCAQREIRCATLSCQTSEVKINLNGTCSSDIFKVQVLEGDFEHPDKFINIYVNDKVVGKCDPGYN
jgi:hypothetical protein